MSTPRQLKIGKLSFLHEPGLIRRLMMEGTEIVRMISAPVRDANWGTFAPVLLSSTVDESGGGIRIDEQFSFAGGALLGTLSFDVRADGRVIAALALEGLQDVQTNRAGFTLLHPIARTIGTALSVTHSEGRVVETQFPQHIAPGQPAIDVAGLAHQIDGVDVSIAFEGETFEIEDQRNWSDASFKTYCRPLSLPFPYTIKKGESVTQRIAITVDRKDNGVAREPASTLAEKVSLPQICLAVEPDWVLAALPKALMPVLRFSYPDAWSSEMLSLIAATHRKVDIEIVVPDGDSPQSACAAVHESLSQVDLEASHVTALPEAYLKSYQPSGPWPQGLSPPDCAKAARQTFPQAHIGVGMLTNFTEFNRCPPETSLGDFITFANTAIVHAADDLSVWETLETLPHIFQSAEAQSGGLPIRLGLVSIGMRSNPYGEEMAANPDGAKITMTGDDPRQCEPFAAAYAMVAFALAAQANVQAITLAAPSGRLGMAGEDGSLCPLGDLLLALANLGPEAELTRRGTHITLSAKGRSISADAHDGGAIDFMGFGAMDG